MNNDLISRKALKEDLFIKFGNQLPNGLFDEIDHAPTITPDKIQALMSDYLIYRWEPERPQGEWEKIITYYNDVAMCLYGEFKCSCCGHLHTFYEIPETNKFNTDNYCGYCGAAMKGGGTNE